jgi:type VI secretion system secreted protein Hcp
MRTRHGVWASFGIFVLGVGLAYTIPSIWRADVPPADAAEFPGRIPPNFVDGAESSPYEELTFVDELRVSELYGSQVQGPWMRLVIDGNDIVGESPVTSLDREGTIDCYGFDHNLYAPYDVQTGGLTGRRVHGPVSVIKRSDRTSVLLYKALAQNEPVTAELMFFRPASDGSGAEERYLTILLEEAYITAVRSAFPNHERVTIRYGWITWTYEPEGIIHRDRGY